MQQNLPALLRDSVSPRSAFGRLVIIVAVLGLSALLAYQTPGGRMAILLLGLPLAGAAALFLLQRPGAGLALVITGGLIVPLSIGTGTNTSLNPVVLLVPALTGLWVVDMAVRRKSIRLRHHPAVYLIIAFSAVAILAFIAGQLPWFDLPSAGLAPQLGGLAVFLFSAAAFLLAAHLLDEAWLRRVIILFLAIGAAFLIAEVVPLLTPIQQLFATGSTGSVFWIWLAALSGAMALFYDGLSSQVRLGLAGLATLTILVAYFMIGEWASGWAPALVALLLLLWLRFPRWGWIVIFVAVLAFLLNFERFWFLATDNEAWLARRQAWQIVLDTVSVNPILGLGPSNYYFYVQQAEIAGWGGVWNVAFSSHNNWVDLIAQTGLLGLVVFIGFVASMGRVGLRLFQQLPDGFPRAYAAACLAGLVGTLVSGLLGDWFLPFVYNVGLEGMRSSILFWVFMGGLLALSREEEQLDR